MKNKFIYQPPMIKMKTLSKNDENAITSSETNGVDTETNVKMAHNCRHCGEFCFIKKKMPVYRGTPPLKVGVVCSKCGETTVISLQEFYALHLKKDNT
jgi:DNA-directed RNA polymerase subunit RPC12/RpoP